MNPRTKKLLIIIIFISLLIFITMYVINLHFIQERLCDLVENVCFKGPVNNESITIDGIKQSCGRAINNICR